MHHFDEASREDLAKALNLICRVRNRMVSTHEFAQDLDKLIAALEKSKYMQYLASREFSELKETVQKNQR